MEDETKNKHEFFLYLLDKGDAMVCLDARNLGVKVPKHLKNNPALSLVFNVKFRRPIEIKQEGICTTLSFQGRPSKCAIPFASIWAIFVPSLKEGQVWEASIPKDVDVAAQMVKNSQPKVRRKAVPRKNGPSRKVPGTLPRSKKDRSHLRVIK